MNNCIRVVAVLIFSLVGAGESAYGDVTWSGDLGEETWNGDLTPSDPTSWTSSTDAYIGSEDDGTLTITDGGTVSDNYAAIGYRGTGVVTVTGSGSVWENSSTLYVGHGTSGKGPLKIEEG